MKKQFLLILFIYFLCTYSVTKVDISREELKNNKFRNREVEQMPEIDK